MNIPSVIKYVLGTLLLMLVVSIVLLVWLASPARQTRFSLQYDESRFLQVNPGMSQQQVIEALGNPVFSAIDHDGTMFWHYTRSSSPRHVVFRVVVIKNDTVKELRHGTRSDYFSHFWSGGNVFAAAQPITVE